MHQKHNNNKDGDQYEVIVLLPGNGMSCRQSIQTRPQRQSTKNFQNTLFVIYISCMILSSLGIQGLIAPSSCRHTYFPFQRVRTHNDDPAATTITRPTCLFATSSKKKKKRPANKDDKSVGGFGGAAMESCPCGSEEAYSKCCGKIHGNINSFRLASPEQVVRARYSAYAKKKPEFLMASTHPTNKAFDPDLKRWKDTIK
jgi:hypothetical protein